MQRTDDQRSANQQPVIRLPRPQTTPAAATASSGPIDSFVVELLRRIPAP